VGAVTIMCPKTGDFVSTGIDLDADRFKAYPPTVSRLRCPSCGSEHAWSKGRAWLAEEAPLVRGGQLSKGVVETIRGRGRASLELHHLDNVINGPSRPPISSPSPKARGMRLHN
jgi:hypothetical protein